MFKCLGKDSAMIRDVRSPQVKSVCAKARLLALKSKRERESSRQHQQAGTLSGRGTLMGPQPSTKNYRQLKTSGKTNH